MNYRKITVGIFIAIAFICSFIAGYLTLKYNKPSANQNLNKTVNKKSIGTPAVAAAANINDKTVINENTKIIKKLNYTSGNPISKEIQEASGPEVLGMDRKTSEEYFKRQGFLMIDFSSKNVILFKDINSWPPNYYVVKGEKDGVNIFYTNDKGELQFLKKSDYSLESLPEGDKAELEKGKAFPKLEDIDNMFEELMS